MQLLAAGDDFVLAVGPQRGYKLGGAITAAHCSCSVERMGRQ